MLKRHTLMAKGICERVGSAEAFHKHGLDDNEVVIDAKMADHDDAIALVLDSLVSGEGAAMPRSLSEIDAVGHRIVQGGKYFDRSVLIDDDVIAKIDELAELAPLHNGAALMGIRACMNHMPGVPMVAVFDTSFFHDVAAEGLYVSAALRALREVRHPQVRRSRHFASLYFRARCRGARRAYRGPEARSRCHLGNGCSASAIDHGVAVDTSMGLTPLDGLMMGTRCGAIDPAIVPFVMEHENLTAEEMNNLMNKQSGLARHLRRVQRPAQRAHGLRERATSAHMLAYDMFSNSVKKYIGQYIAVMGGVDAIVLTAGVGENCDKMRRMIFSGLQPLGIVLDEEKNRQSRLRARSSPPTTPKCRSSSSPPMRST